MLTREEKEKLAVRIFPRCLEGYYLEPQPTPEFYKQYWEACTKESVEIPTSAGTTKLYIIRTAERPAEPQPVILHFPGGGFLIPHMDKEMWLCSLLACEAGAVVVDVVYHTSLFVSYPVPVEEAYAALQWVIANAGSLGIDPTRIACEGNSAGGNLSIATALKSKGDTYRPMALALSYPVTDQCTPPDQKRDAYDTLILPPKMKIYNDLYADDEDKKSIYVSPVLATAEDLEGFPETMIMTAGKDNIRHEDAQFACVLHLAGIPVHMHCYVGEVHGFSIEGIGRGYEANLELAHFLKWKFEK